MRGVGDALRVWGERMGSHNDRNAGESESVMIMIHPIFSPRTVERRCVLAEALEEGG